MQRSQILFLNTFYAFSWTYNPKMAFVNSKKPMGDQATYAGWIIMHLKRLNIFRPPHCSSAAYVGTATCHNMTGQDVTKVSSTSAGGQTIAPM